LRFLVFGYSPKIGYLMSLMGEVLSGLVFLISQFRNMIWLLMVWTAENFRKKTFLWMFLFSTLHIGRLTGLRILNPTVWHLHTSLELRVWTLSTMFLISILRLCVKLLVW